MLALYAGAIGLGLPIQVVMWVLGGLVAAAMAWLMRARRHRQMRPSPPASTAA